MRRQKVKRSELLFRMLKSINQISKNKKEISMEDLQKQRLLMERIAVMAKAPLGVDSRSFEIDGIPAQWHIPSISHKKKPIVLYCHGGGYTCGGIRFAGIIASKIAYHCGVDVLSFEYRLAPEHRYPAQLRDSLKVWDYLMHLGYGASEIILAGDSAGGNLALSLALNLKEMHRFLPRGIVLLSPWTDMTCSSDSYEIHKEDDPTISYDYVMSCVDAYLPHGANPADSAYSPLFSDFSDFPPTLIQAGEMEVLQDDSRKLYEKMKRKGVPVQFKIFEGGWHVFQQMPLPLASSAIYEIGEFIHGL